MNGNCIGNFKANALKCEFLWSGARVRVTIEILWFWFSLFKVAVASGMIPFGTEQDMLQRYMFSASGQE